MTGRFAGDIVARRTRTRKSLWPRTCTVFSTASPTAATSPKSTLCGSIVRTRSTVESTGTSSFSLDGVVGADDQRLLHEPALRQRRAQDDRQRDRLARVDAGQVGRPRDCVAGQVSLLGSLSVTVREDRLWIRIDFSGELPHRTSPKSIGSGVTTRAPAEASSFLHPDPKKSAVPAARASGNTVHVSREARIHESYRRRGRRAAGPGDGSLAAFAVGRTRRRLLGDESPMRPAGLEREGRLAARVGDELAAGGPQVRPRHRERRWVVAKGLTSIQPSASGVQVERGGIRRAPGRTSPAGARPRPAAEGAPFASTSRRRSRRARSRAVARPARVSPVSASGTRRGP